MDVLVDERECRELAIFVQVSQVSSMHYVYRRPVWLKRADEMEDTNSRLPFHVILVISNVHAGCREGSSQLR